MANPVEKLYREHGISSAIEVLKHRDTSKHIHAKRLLSSYSLYIYNELLEPFNQSMTNIGDSILLRHISKDELACFLFFDRFDKLVESQLYGLGRLFYNEGVNLIIKLDPDSELDELVGTQERVVLLFENAKGFLDRACDLNPRYCEGREGIDYMLDQNKKGEIININTLQKD